jgi:hypothetical protein
MAVDGKLGEGQLWWVERARSGLMLPNRGGFGSRSGNNHEYPKQNAEVKKSQGASERMIDGQGSFRQR